jgi:hypothetical protein
VKNISYDEFLDKTSLDFEIIGNFFLTFSFKSINLKFLIIQVANLASCAARNHGRAKSQNTANAKASTRLNSSWAMTLGTGNISTESNLLVRVIVRIDR